MKKVVFILVVLVLALVIVKGCFLKPEPVIVVTEIEEVEYVPMFPNITTTKPIIEDSEIDSPRELEIEALIIEDSRRELEQFVPVVAEDKITENVTEILKSVPETLPKEEAVEQEEEEEALNHNFSIISLWHQNRR